jgi:hypothetical protein
MIFESDIFCLAFFFVAAMYVLLSNPTTSRGSMHARCTERELGLEDKKERTFYFATKEAESWQGFFAWSHYDFGPVDCASPAGNPSAHDYTTL